jgi:hypothetical protein
MSEHSKTWRVKWANPNTGQTGHGEAAFYRHEAAIWADHANKDPNCVPCRHDIEDTAP